MPTGRGTGPIGADGTAVPPVRAKRSRRVWRRVRRSFGRLGRYRPVVFEAVQILRRRGAVSYSQEGEDRILVRLLGDTRNGFYVDIGSHHPIRFSNTYLLYRQGWRGITIDPIRSSAAVHRSIRPLDIALEMAVGLEAGSRPYYQFDEPALNTLSSERAAMLVETTRYRLIETRQVQVEPLAKILQTYLPAGRVVDLLSIDTEGSDAEILASNDWDRFRPRIIVAEVLDVDDFDQVEGAEVVKALRARGYRPVAMTVNSVFFADRMTAPSAGGRQ